MGSYTTSELERDTGFGRRTIAYYVQEGLLPRVGRRGPRTRYPELVRDRLLFIRRVREAEAESEIRPVRLSDLRELFKALPAEVIARVAAGEIPVTAGIVSQPPLERRSMVDRVAALRERLLAAPPELDVESRMARLREDERMGLRAAESKGFDEDWPDEARAEDAFALRRETRRGMEEPDFQDEVASPGGRYGSSAEPDEETDTDTLRELGWVLEELQAQARRHRERVPDEVDIWSQIEVTSDIRLSARGISDEDAFLLRVAGRLLRQVLESWAPSSERGSREPGE